MTCDRRRACVAAAVFVAAVAMTACQRETRYFEPPTKAVTPPPVRLSQVQPGAISTDTSIESKYEDTAYALSEGKRLYENFNCAGCHFHGGGGIGPPLMDDKWIYGSEPQQIFATVVQGRPNGMPSFHGKINDYQLWQIVAYVRSMSGLTNKNAAPGRSDQMKTAQPPNSVPTSQPMNSVVKPVG